MVTWRNQILGDVRCQMCMYGVRTADMTLCLSQGEPSRRRVRLRGKNPTNPGRKNLGGPQWLGPCRAAKEREGVRISNGPGALQHGDERIAAIAPAGRSADLPNPGLALRRAPVEPGTEPKPERAPKDDTKPAADPNCTVPPSAELEIRRAARTIVRIAAPCQPESVAELNYSGLRLAIPLDRQGQGKVLALGFEANAAAVVKFTDGKEINFDLPFRGIGRIERIAVVWDIPVALELHALEFGAKTGDDNHVNPQNPRAFGDVRRAGGGFLHTYRGYAGYGQNAQIYTHWKRRGGEGGIVKLMIDYASRNRDRLDGTCGTGTYAAPGFFVLRSSSGRLTKSATRQLASLSCSRVSEEIGDKRLISGAIRDLVVTN